MKNFQKLSGGNAIADESETTTAAEVLDELSLEESKFYKAKVGKYLRTTLQNVQYGVFWWIVFVAHRSREPLLHFYAALCKEARAADKSAHHIVNLMSVVIPQIQLDFQDLFETLGEWTEEAWEYAGISPRTNTIDPQDLPVMISTMIALLLYNSAAFHRRITLVFGRWLGLNMPSTTGQPISKSTSISLNIYNQTSGGDG